MVGRDMGGAELEGLIAEEAEASERTRDEPLPGRAARKRPTRSVVYSIRLTPGQTEETQRIAEAAGIPAAGLVRGWVLQGLVAEREGAVGPTGEALARGLARGSRRGGRGLVCPAASAGAGQGAGPLVGPRRAAGAGRGGPPARPSFSPRGGPAGPRPPWNGSWTGCR